MLNSGALLKLTGTLRYKNMNGHVYWNNKDNYVHK